MLQQRALAGMGLRVALSTAWLGCQTLLEAAAQRGARPRRIRNISRRGLRQRHARRRDVRRARRWRRRRRRRRARPRGGSLLLPGAVRGCHGDRRFAEPRCVVALRTTRWLQMEGDLPEREFAGTNAGAAGATAAAGASDVAARLQTGAGGRGIGAGADAAALHTSVAASVLGRVVARARSAPAAATAVAPPYRQRLWQRVPLTSCRRRTCTIWRFAARRSPGARYKFELQALAGDDTLLGAAAVVVDVNRPPAWMGGGAAAAARSPPAIFFVTPATGAVRASYAIHARRRPRMGRPGRRRRPAAALCLRRRRARRRRTARAAATKADRMARAASARPWAPARAAAPAPPRPPRARRGTCGGSTWARRRRVAGMRLGTGLASAASTPSVTLVLSVADRFGAEAEAQTTAEVAPCPLRRAGLWLEPVAGAGGPVVFRAARAVLGAGADGARGDAVGAGGAARRAPWPPPRRAGLAAAAGGGFRPRRPRTRCWPRWRGRCARCWSARRASATAPPTSFRRCAIPAGVPSRDASCGGRRTRAAGRRHRPRGGGGGSGAVARGQRVPGVGRAMPRRGVE